MVTEYFFYFFHLGRIFFQIEQFFPIFPGATMKLHIRLRKDRKWVENINPRVISQISASDECTDTVFIT